MRLRLLFALLAVLMTSGPARAAELRVLTTGAFKPLLAAFAPGFARETGHVLVIANDTAGGVARRVAAGEASDLVVLTPGPVADLTARGLLVPGTAADLARVGIGVAVREGEPRPDLSSVEAFRAAILAAPSVAYLDPAAGGSSGVYLDGLFRRLDLAEAVRAKAVLVPGGLVAERVVRGEAALGLHQVSEILAVPGAVLAGTLPAEIQNTTIYTGAIGAAAREPEAARALLAALRGEHARALLREKGLEAAAP